MLHLISSKPFLDWQPKELIKLETVNPHVTVCDLEDDVNLSLKFCFEKTSKKLMFAQD